MHIRAVFALLIGASLASCSLIPGASQAPTSAPPSATTAPASATTASAPTAEATPTAANAPTTEPAPTAAAASTSGTSASTAKFESSTCKFEAPASIKVVCGYVTVPENRTTNSGKTIRLAVATFKTNSKSPKADPIVYLEGGPGGNALSNWGKYFDRAFAPVAGDRDFIIFDQRGTGFSEPSLACPEYTEEAYFQLDKQYSVAESTKRVNDALFKCHDRLNKQNIDFTAYNSVESAGDVNDIRQALGYKEWNIYGISYGTRLALTTMREHPEGIRSVVIDSVVPPQVNESQLPANVDRAFTTFFKGCTASDTCNKAFPNLETTFYKLIDTLNAKPVMQDYTDPADGKAYKVLLTGDAVQGALFNSLYQTSAIPLMPRAIADAAAGTDYSLLTRLTYQSTSQNKDFSIGMYYAVRCNEEVSFETQDQLAAAEKPYPKQNSLFDPGTYAPVCNAWKAGTAPAVENQPVRSDLPTLVTSGEYDPVTPPSNGQAAASTLPHSFFFEFPGFGHGASLDGDCPIGITKAFFDNPTTKPDASCINDLKGPDFALPEGPITLTPFDNANASVKGVIPNTWKKVGDIAYTNAAGDLAILQFASSRTRAETITYLKQQFSISEPTAAGDRSSQGNTWSLYTVDFQGSPGNLGLAESGGKTLVVLLISTSSTQKKLYDTLFIPALDALQLR